jgi:hypothetical protein
MEKISKEIKDYNASTKDALKEDISSAVGSGLLQLEKKQLERLFQIINLTFESNNQKQTIKKLIKNLSIDQEKK